MIKKGEEEVKEEQEKASDNLDSGDKKEASKRQKKADDKRETPITIRRYPCMLPKFNLFVDLQYS